MTSLRKLASMRLLAVVCALWISVPVVMRAATWVLGDVFAGLADGSYNVYSNAGVFKQNVSTGVVGGFATGCAFDPGLNKLVTTNFVNGKVVVISTTDPHPVLQTINDTANPGGAVDPESVTFSTSGNFYVGHADGSHRIYKYDITGTFLQSYAPTTGPRGTDFSDLSSDQHTMFYTSEGGIIYRFDVTGVGTQLSNFATGLPGPCYGHRNLPPGDGSGGVLVACTSAVLRVNSSGAVVHTYVIPGATLLFAMDLDPNGTSFWGADLGAGKIWRVNIATGAIEVGPITTGQETGGLCVLGEITGSGGGGGPACPHHRVHGHIDTVPPGGHNGVVAGIHHGQHGHLVTPGAECPPHAPFHSPGLTAEAAGEGLFSANAVGQEPSFVAGLNQDGTLNGSLSAVAGAKVLPAHRGTVVQLFGSAEGLFLDAQDLRAASGFTPPASGSPLFYTTSLPEVRIGGIPAQVLFSGLAPGLTGVWQINVLIPNGVQPGNVPVTVNYEGDELTSINLAIE